MISEFAGRRNRHRAGLRWVVMGRVEGIREFRMPGTPILPTSGGDAVAVQTQIGATVEG